MNIGKKLYVSFGIILATVLVLLAINPIAVQREHETKAAAQRSIDMTEATSSVRFQMMQNRLHLRNYLLSGDTRDVEKMSSDVLDDVDRRTAVMYRKNFWYPLAWSLHEYRENAQ